MLLQDKETGTLVEVMDFQSLINTSESQIVIQMQEGQEEQDPETLQKKNLSFPSGEDLPICWVDANYRNR
jgi:hypothetical protein